MARARLFIALLMFAAAAALAPGARADTPPRAAVLKVDPPSFNFSAIAHGANPPSQSLLVTNDGGGTMRFTLSDSATWLHLSRSSGTAPASTTVSVSTFGLAPGVYSGNIKVTAAGATASPRSLPVTLWVKAP